MAAYFDTGFSVRHPSWHRQELLLDDYPTDWADARKKAGLEWEPTYADLYVKRLVPAICRLCAAPYGQPHDETCEFVATSTLGIVHQDACVPEGAVPVDANDDGIVCHVPTSRHQAIVRNDTWAELATPLDSFKLIYHSQMGELLDAYTESWRKAGAEVKFETAGSIRGGAMVWALVWLDEPYHVPGDDSPTYPFAALLNAHDGSAACKLLPTQVRIVCWNTWKAAEFEGERSGHQTILRHSGNVGERLEDAKRALGEMRDEAKAWQVAASDLATLNVDDDVFRAFLDDFIPIPEGAADRTRNERLSRQETFRKLYTESPTCEPLPNTAYKLVQAAGEYLDHLRPFRSSDTYLSRTMFTADTTKTSVVRRVRELVR